MFAWKRKIRYDKGVYSITLPKPIAEFWKGRKVDNVSLAYDGKQITMTPILPLTEEITSCI